MYPASAIGPPNPNVPSRRKYPRKARIDGAAGAAIASSVRSSSVMIGPPLVRERGGRGPASSPEHLDMIAAATSVLLSPEVVIQVFEEVRAVLEPLFVLAMSK